MKRTALLTAAILTLATASPGVVAHHAFAAEFDREQPFEVTGKVTKVEWMNPHARFYVDVENEAGVVENWNFELGSPNGLMRMGWRRNTLEPGAEVRVTGWRARNHPLVGNAGEVYLADGTRLFADSSANNRAANNPPAGI
jgi:hypothetical protein